MNSYKFTRSGGSFYMDFSSFEEANSFSLLLEPMIVEQMANSPSLSISQKLESDKNFCLYLLDRFTKENREAGITEEEAQNLLIKFKEVLSMAQVGAVPSVYSLLQNIVIDSIYTQIRKDKDLSDIQNYINSF